ncbi:phytoene desaturase family protein, partial [Actinomyces sp.]
AWFPSGGSGQIARMIEEGIVGAGGQIRLAQEVEEILVEDGTAVGVRVTDRSGPAPVSYEERAPIIISGIGARETYTRLLPTTGPTAALTARVRERIARLGHGASAVTLYLALDRYPDGVDGSNVWINTATGRADPARMSADLLGGHPHSAFISFPGIKSGDTHATAEIVSFAQPKAFQRWAGTRPGLRGEDYEALTSAMSQGLIDLADAAVPGLKDAVRYAEVGTPLTIEHFTSHSLGCFYGLPLTPERFRADLATPSTPVTGLFLTGQDAGMPGIVGAALAGMSAACKVLGPSGYPRINRGAAGGGYQASQLRTLSRIRGSAQRRSEALSSNSATRQLDHPNYPRHHTPAPAGWNLGCGSVRARAGRPFRMAALFHRLRARESRAPARGRAHPGAWCGVGTPRTKRRRGGS